MRSGSYVIQYIERIWMKKITQCKIDIIDLCTQRKKYKV